MRDRCCIRKSTSRTIGWHSPCRRRPFLCQRFLLPRAPVSSLSTVLCFAVFLLFSAGCRNCHLVERELRETEAKADRLRLEVERLEALNTALIKELQALKPGFQPHIVAEPTSLSYGVKEIVLGRQTSGFDDDGMPGDEALQVVIEPRDPDGHSIKAPGSLTVTALAIDPQGLKHPFSTWEFSQQQLRTKWRSGLFSTGYHVVLPWRAPPPSDKIRVVVQFRLNDGRLFEADKDITIRVPPLSKAAPDPAEEILPKPRVLTPESESKRLPDWPPQTTSFWRPKAINTSVRGVELFPPVP
ncbi:MAG: hypothetical protein KatS3mg105_1002 [Gemmatales bacterium]|nr:MAG: hypothetical protein KatS3mg105_1002 [Gemmatales bacterium]